jgi:hypothetical protein
MKTTSQVRQELFQAMSDDIAKQLDTKGITRP